MSRRGAPELSQFQLIGPAKLLGGAYLTGMLIFLLGLPLLLAMPPVKPSDATLVVVASATFGVLLHEGAHFTVAKLLSIEGLKVRWTPHGPALVHGGMAKRSWVAVALAPLAASAIVMVLSLFETSPALKLVLFGSSWVSAASSGVDVATAAHVIKAPSGARLLVLYGGSGDVLGGVVEAEPPIVLLIKRAKLAAVRREGDYYVAVEELPKN